MVCLVCKEVNFHPFWLNLENVEDITPHLGYNMVSFIRNSESEELVKGEHPGSVLAGHLFSVDEESSWPGQETAEMFVLSMKSVPKSA
jgi:hypothetical protein